MTAMVLFFNEVCISNGVWWCSSIHRAGESGLVQPAWCGPHKNHGELVQKSRNNADAARVQCPNTSAHHGSWFHHQKLQRGRELLLRGFRESSVRHTGAQRRDRDAIALEFAMKSFSQTQHVGLRG